MAGGIKLQDAATTGNGNAFNFRGLAGEYAFSIEPSGTVSGGSVQFEEAPSSDYSGTWNPIDDAVTPATGTFQVVRKRGRYRAVRARIASNITGGGGVTCRVDPPLLGESD